MDYRKYLSNKDLKDFAIIDSFKSNIKELSDYDILGYQPYPQQYQWYKWAFDGKSKEKLLLGAREYGKSDIILIYGIVKQLIKNPSLTFLIMTRTQERVKHIISTIGDILITSGLKGSYNKTYINLDITDKRNKKQPNVLAITVNGRTKGNHADYLIMDDPLDPLDEHLVAIKKRIRKVYMESSNIAKNLIIIGQYVSEDDLYVDLENKIDTLTCWHGSITELDKDKEEFLKTKTEREWGLNYGGFIIAGSEAPFRDIEEIESDPSGTVFAFIDPSFKGDDYTALSIGWRVNNFLVVRGYVFKESWSRSLDKMVNILKENKVNNAYYEDNGVGDAIYFNTGGLIKPYTSRGNKEGRIARIEGLVNNGLVKIKIPKTINEKDYLKMVKIWSPLGSVNDDAPDSLATLCKIIGMV